MVFFIRIVAVHIALRLTFIVHLYLIIFIRPLTNDIIDGKKNVQHLVAIST